MKNPIYPCLWFDGNAKEAADFYCSVFPNSGITTNTPMVVMFELNGRKFMGLNGGSMFKFNEATSFVVECNDQDEIDHYWYRLTADGGAESMCGWLRDKFGVSWQIVPHHIGSLMAGEPDKSNRAIQAMLKMKKLNISELESAYNQ